jgi:GcrA cell cycle regulator
LSASQIAAQLGGVSRNAVIGKVHRLCLPGRAKAGGTSSATRPTKRSNAAPARPTTFGNRPAAQRTAARPEGATMVKEEAELDATAPVPFRPASNVIVPIARRLGLTDLTERTCKWPVGDPLKDDFHFCGHESPDQSPYCTYHQKLAYQPVHERRRAAR